MSSTCSETLIPGQSSMVPAETASTVGQNKDLRPSQSHTAPMSGRIASSSPVTTDAPPVCLGTMSTEVEQSCATEPVSIEEVNSTVNLETELPPVQPMEQEILDVNTPNQLDSVEMAPSSGPEKNEPESEHRARSNSIPSLAAALKELHELIVSNKSSQTRSASTSPTPRLPVPDGPETRQSEPSTTAITQITDAKADPSHTTTTSLSNEGLSECVELPSNEDNIEVEVGESLEEQKAQQCQAVEARVEGSVPDVTDLSNLPSSEASLEMVGEEFREELNAQQEAERAPSNNNLQTVSPLSMEVANDQDNIITTSDTTLASPNHPQDPLAPVLARLSSQTVTPQTIVGPFPVEHIQRIQAAGFSAQEAAEALERANGVVEIALFALLARSITVPT